MFCVLLTIVFSYIILIKKIQKQNVNIEFLTNQNQSLKCTQDQAMFTCLKVMLTSSQMGEQGFHRLHLLAKKSVVLNIIGFKFVLKSL